MFKELFNQGFSHRAMIRAIVIHENTALVDILCHQFKLSNSKIKLVKRFQEVADALRYFSKFPVDLVFLDESKKEESLKLLEFGQRISFVYFTKKELHEVNFVRQNFVVQDVAEFEKNWVEMVEERRLTDSNDISFFVRADFELHQIFFNEIVYAESLGDYIKFVQDGKRPLVVKMSMKALEDTLPKSDFTRIHRSYILNRRKIEKIKSKSVLIASQEIPIGTTYLNRLQ
jgi:hypothetical protein